MTKKQPKKTTKKELTDIPMTNTLNIEIKDNKIVLPKQEHNLTDKQTIWCKEYLIDMNATRASKAAGYSEDSARQIGSENLSKPYIQDELARLNQERIERVEITADDVIKDLITIKDKCMQITPVTFKDGTLRKEWTTDENGEDIEAGVYTFNANGATRALELIGKNIVMWTDKIEHSGEVKTNISDQSKDDIINELKGLMGGE